MRFVSCFFLICIIVVPVPFVCCSVKLPLSRPTSFCLFPSILLRTPAGVGAAAWRFCYRLQPKPEHGARHIAKIHSVPHVTWNHACDFWLFIQWGERTEDVFRKDVVLWEEWQHVRDILLYNSALNPRVELVLFVPSMVYMWMLTYSPTFFLQSTEKNRNFLSKIWFIFYSHLVLRNISSMSIQESR